MADNCYNLIEFIGNDAVLKKVKEWKQQLDGFEATTDDPFCMRAISAVFYAEFKSDNTLDFGSKWVHQDNNSIDANENQLSLQSAWNRPFNLENRIACLLYKLDPNVILRNTFYVENETYGVAYTTPVSSEKSYSQEVSVEIDTDEFDDIVEAEEQAELRLTEEEQEMLNDLFLDDMPHLASILKARFPQFQFDAK